MGCPRTVAKIVKRVAKTIPAVIIGHAVDMVQTVETASTTDPEFWTNETKRRAVWGSVKGQANEAALDIKDRTINLIVEFAVEAVKGPDDESDVGVDGSAVTVTGSDGIEI